MGGGGEGVEEAEEARAILRVEEITIEEGVESREEVRIVEIVIPDERPETIEAQKCNDALLVDRVLEKIHQKDGVGHMRDEARVCDEEGALVLVLGEGKLEKGEPSGLEGAAMRLKRKQGVNAILLRGLLLLRLRAGRPIPIVILGLVLGAEKGSDINVSRALAPAGCAGRADVAAVIFGGSGWALQNSSISLAAVGIVEIPSKIANALPVSSRTPAGSVACASIFFF
jgi:hypothetical protein